MENKNLNLCFFVNKKEEEGNTISFLIWSCSYIRIVNVINVIKVILRIKNRDSLIREHEKKGHWVKIIVGSENFDTTIEIIGETLDEYGYKYQERFNEDAPQIFTVHERNSYTNAAVT